MWLDDKMNASVVSGRGSWIKVWLANQSQVTCSCFWLGRVDPQKEPILAADVAFLCQKLLNIKQTKEVLNYRTPNL